MGSSVSPEQQPQYSPDNPFAPKAKASVSGVQTYSADNPFAPSSSTASAGHENDAEEHAPPSVVPAPPISEATRKVGRDALEYQPTSVSLTMDPPAVQAERTSAVARRIAQLRSLRVAAPADATAPTPPEESGTNLDVLVKHLSGELNPQEPPTPKSLVGRTALTLGKMAAHPIETAIGIATAVPAAAYTLGKFARQEEFKESARLRSVYDPKAPLVPGSESINPPGTVTPGKDVVTPREAAFAAGQLLVPGVASKALPYLDKLFGAAMATAAVKAVEAGESPSAALLAGYAARLGVHTAAGAATGAVFSPQDPAVGALLGAALGGAHAASQTPSVRAPVREAPDVPKGQARLGSGPRAPIQGTATAAAPTPAPQGPDFSVEGLRDHLPGWDERTMGPKPTVAEHEAFKQRAVASFLDQMQKRAAAGEKVPGFGQSPREPIPPTKDPRSASPRPVEPIGDPREGTRVVTPPDLGSSVPPDDRVTIGEPVPAEGRRFPATTQAVSDLVSQRGLSVDDAVAHLNRAGYDVAPNVVAAVRKEIGEKPETFDHSSTQVQLSAPVATKVRDFAARIPDEQLAKDGRETDPHITVKYGLHTEDPEQVRALLKNQGPITVRLGKTSLFQNDDADVLKVDVESPELHALNEKIADALPNSDTHPEYKPHATIAYLKPGQGKRYAGDSSLAGETMTLHELTFSGKNGEKVVIPLTGGAASEESPKIASEVQKVAPNAPSVAANPPSVATPEKTESTTPVPHLDAKDVRSIVNVNGFSDLAQQYGEAKGLSAEAAQRAVVDAYRTHVQGGMSVKDARKATAVQISQAIAPAEEPASETKPAIAETKPAESGTVAAPAETKPKKKSTRLGAQKKEVPPGWDVVPVPQGKGFPDHYKIKAPDGTLSPLDMWGDEAAARKSLPDFAPGGQHHARMGEQFAANAPKPESHIRQLIRGIDEGPNLFESDDPDRLERGKNRYEEIERRMNARPQEEGYYGLPDASTPVLPVPTKKADIPLARDEAKHLYRMIEDKTDQWLTGEEMRDFPSRYEHNAESVHQWQQRLVDGGFPPTRPQAEIDADKGSPERFKQLYQDRYDPMTLLDIRRNLLKQPGAYEHSAAQVEAIESILNEKGVEIPKGKPEKGKTRLRTPKAEAPTAEPSKASRAGPKKYSDEEAAQMTRDMDERLTRATTKYDKRHDTTTLFIPNDPSFSDKPADLHITGKVSLEEAVSRHKQWMLKELDWYRPNGPKGPTSHQRLEAERSAKRLHTSTIDNPFRDRASRARKLADSLHQPTAHEQGMAESFTLGAGFGRGNKARKVDASVSRAARAVDAEKNARHLEAQSAAFDRGEINAQGHSIDTDSLKRSDKRQQQKDSRQARQSAATAQRQGKEPWQVTSSVYADSVGHFGGSARQLALSDHRSAVDQAVASGKAVPPEVLAEYPTANAASTLESPEATISSRPLSGARAETTERHVPAGVDLEDAANTPNVTDVDTPLVKAARTYTAEHGSTIDIDTPERQALRMRTVEAERDRIASRARANFGRIGTGEFGHVIGLPGSGKSSNAVEPLAKYLSAIVSDVDEVKERLPEYEQGWGSERVYREAGAIARHLREGHLNPAKLSYIQPGIGADPEGTLRELDRLAAAGYKVHLVRVQISPATARERAVSRFEDGGHFVRPEYVDYVGDKDAQTYERAKTHPAVIGYALIDNDGARPRVIESRNAPWLSGFEGYSESEGRGGNRAGDDSDSKELFRPEKADVESPPGEQQGGSTNASERGLSHALRSGKPSTRDALKQLFRQAFDDWTSGRAYVDNNGNYRLKGRQYDERGVLLAREQRVATRMAPWNKEVKAAFPDNSDFHKAASEWAKQSVHESRLPGSASKTKGRPTPAPKPAARPAGGGKHPMPEPSGLAQPRANLRLRELGTSIRSTFLPESLGHGADLTAATIRHQAARGFREYRVAAGALDDFRKAVDALSRDDAVTYWGAAETGQSTGNPEYDAGNRLLQDVTANLTQELITLDRLKAESTIDNYIGRFWSKPTTTKATNFLARIRGKRPFEGPKSFLKRRSLEHFADGLDAGLIPATYNYVESQLAKIAEMQRVITAERILRSELGNGRARKVLDTMGGEVPVDAEGEKWVRIGQDNDPAFTIFGPPVIDVHEAFDAGVREKLQAAIKRLGGVDLTRKVAVGRKILGYAVNDKEIVSKFGSHDGVIIHELGHILDHRFDLRGHFARSSGTAAELRELAELRWRGATPEPEQKFKDYVQKPEEQVANALHALIHAPDLMGQVAPTTKKVLTDFLKSRAETRDILDIKPSLRLDTGTAEQRVPGIPVVGHWYAPRQSAAVWRNHLSKGPRGSAGYDAAVAPGRAATQILLGLSGFHGTVIATEGMFSDMVAAADQLARGDVPGSAKALGRVVGSPATSAVSAIASTVAPKAKASRLAFGAKVMEEYAKPGTHPELAKVIEAMVAGGFRGQAESEMWSGDRTTALKRAVREAIHGDSALRKAWGATKIPFDAIYAGIELASKPLMSKYVPLMKTAATYHAAANRLEDLGPKVSPERLEREMWDVVKEMDLRFGHVVYDNYFINAVAKDLAQAMFLAPGWTFGTLALMGRGVRDVAIAPKRLYDRASGKAGAKGDPILGRSGKYWAAAVVGTMLLNGILTYLSTGKRPGTDDDGRTDGWKDFFAFRDGTKDSSGNPNRHTIPGYLMHDVYGWTHHPYKTLLNKLAPFWAFSARLARNETYFGDKIWNPDAPLGTRVKQTGREVAKEFAPISVQNYLESRSDRQEAGGNELARNLFGVGPAKREFVRTPAQNEMARILADRGRPARTPEAVDRHDERQSLTLDFRKGEVSRDSLHRLQRSGELTKGQSRNVIRSAREDPLLTKFKLLTAEEATRVYALGTAREQKIWKRLLDSKVRRSRPMNQPQRLRLGGGQ